MTTPEELANTHSKPLINLLRGWPSTSLLPVSLIKQATQNVLSNPTVSDPGLLYGPDTGHPPLRKALAAWLTEFYEPAQAVTPERIAITGGASQNLAGLLQVYTDPVFTRNVWMVAPAYMLAFRSFEDAGFSGKLRAVPEDEEGIDLGFLRREIHKSEEKAKAEGNTKPTFKPARPYAKIYRHVIYCVPTFANPSSRTMSLSHRKELVRCAREYDALVICDDVYDFLQWPADIKTEQSSLDKAVMPRVVDIDRVLDGGAERADSDGFGNVVSNASFSKIGAPGMRTGWVEGTEKFAYGVAQTGGTWSGGAPSQMSSTYISDLLESGALQSHVLRTLQPAYASRYRTLVSAIDRYLVPLGITLPQPDRAIVGGYFVWLHLPDGLSGAALARRAKEEENVIVPEGEMFEVPGDEEAARFGDNVRLCFSWEDEDKLVEGVRRLSGVVRRMQRDGERGGSQPQTAAAREAKHDLGAFR